MAKKMDTAEKIVKALCRRELFREATEMVQFILESDDETAPFKLDGTYSKKVEELQEKLEMFELTEPDQYLNYDAWVDWQVEWNDMEAELAVAKQAAKYETFVAQEWWLCSDWMGQKLEEHGEIVIFTEGFAIWGRQTYGTDPCKEEVFKDIAYDIEILPAQAHDWSEYVKDEK